MLEFKHLFTHLFSPLFTLIIFLCPACLPPSPSSLSNAENTTIIRPSADPSCQDPAQNASCVNACNLYESNCPADSACIWLDQLEGEVIAQCIAELPLGNQTQGEACHLAQNYWGDCQTDQICMSLFTESLSCMSICDSKNLSVCGQTPEQSHQGCLLDIFSGFEGIGICAGECDPFENSYELLKGYQNPKCPTEMACEYQTYALVANQSEKLIGKCQPFSPNLQRERAVCRVMNAQTGESDCAPNLTCTQIEAGGPSVCVKICQKDNPLGACSSEYECDTKSHQKAWGTTTIGFCL